MATKKFKCTVCGYIHEGKAAPETCPVCAAPASAFVEIEDAKKKGMLSDKNGNAYIIMYSTVMVVIVATLLAVAALSLQSRQYANELNEKKQSILSSLSAQAPKVMLGIDVLESRNFAPIAGKRVGLLTHPAGVNRFGTSTIDILRRAKNVKLVALFGPEHGIYGDEKADVPVLDRIDRRTGLPVYSLYGKYRKPTPEMLKKIDALIIDLQDVGARSYTYASCMLRAMEACFENGKTVVVLDSCLLYTSPSPRDS